MNGTEMNSLTLEIRDEIVRGVILSVLIRHRLEWVTFRNLWVQVQRGQGFPLEESELKFHLNYLSDSARGYLENKPMRAGRGGTEFSFVRATAKAVDLHDGRLPLDPGVAF